MLIKNKLQRLIEEITTSSMIKIDQPSSADHGDYATNLALIEAKRQNTNPLDLAKEIKSKLEENNEVMSLVEKIEVASPGFINFWIRKEVLIEEVDRSLDFAGDDKKRIIVEYSSPNIAKRFSVGHFRSTIIGQAIYNLYKFSGYEVLGLNHLGDWGTQFGVILAAIEENSTPSDTINLDVLEKLYVEFSQKMKDSDEARFKAREWFKKLENGDSQARSLWQTIRDISLEEFEETYNTLGVHVDEVRGESEYEDKMQAVIDEAKSIGLSSVGEGGALIVEFETMPPAMLVKSDGTTTYFTRDLAAIKYRVEKDHANKIIYEVGSEQLLHFKQVFEAASKFDWGKNVELVHIPHGMIRLPEGKMSTRRGNTIKLEELISEAIDKSSKLNSDKSVAKMVAIGALKYNDLKRNPASEMIFKWDEVLSMEGNSGPYIQYTYARANSVLNKTQNTRSKPQDTNNLDNQEEVLLRVLARFNEVIFNATESYSPNVLCNYLYELSQVFNTFYNSSQILGSDNEETRLWLTLKTSEVLKCGLNLLGIEAPEKM